MKRLFFVPVFVFMALSFLSCEDDNLNPLPEMVKGQYMRLDIKTREMNYTDINNTAFTGTLSNPSGTVVKYDLYVRRRDPDQFLTGDYVFMKTIDSFPYELSITPQMVATALGIDVADLEAGDTYTFFGYSYDAAGVKAGYIDLARVLQVTATMEQGYKFNTALSINPLPLDAEVPYNNHLTNP